MEQLEKIDQLEKINRATNVLKGIAHPIRLSIMELLKDGDRLCVTDIHERINVEQAVTSQHLKILKEKNILDVEKQGKHCIYFMKNEGLKRLFDCIELCNECF
ncbi:MAG TPA: transcriptional regulator [Flavobacteriales bacterium]|jgi:DNA-binding transcriptional ArsR family regulator|nr:transcriptional regulator [Flavobacteriales bacterium]